jgi:hypothetical protein
VGSRNQAGQDLRHKTPGSTRRLVRELRQKSEGENWSGFQEQELSKKTEFSIQNPGEKMNSFE